MNCKFCKKEFQAKKRGRPAVFCSRDCQVKGYDLDRRKLKPEFVERSCKNCGKTFIKNRSSQKKVCSDSCYKKSVIEKVNCSRCKALINVGSKTGKCLPCFNADAVPHNKKFPTREDERSMRRWRERSAVGLNERERRKLLNYWKSLGLCCSYCSNDCETVDHVIPLVRGGNNFIGNLVPACRKCNSSKGSKLLIEWKRYAGSSS